MKKSILIVFPDSRIQASVHKFLSEVGYNVKTAADAKSAVDMICHFIPDLILCQSDLPGITGEQFAGLLRGYDQFKNTPFLLVGRKGNTNPAPDAVSEVITLPFKRASLYGTVSNWLETTGQPRQDTTRETLNDLLASVTAETKPKKKKQGPKKVNCVTVSRTLSNLISDGQQGVLSFRGHQKAMDVLIRPGRVVDVVSTYIREDSFGSFLIRHKKLSPRENALSLKRAKAENTLQGQVLMSMGILDKRELEQCLTEHKAMKFMRLFEGKWDNAAYDFLPRSVATSEYTMESVPLRRVLKSGILTKAGGDDLYEAFVRNSKQDRPIHLTRHFGKVVEMFKLDRGGVGLAKWINYKTIDEIKLEIPEQFDSVLRLAFLLVVSNGARFGEPKPVQDHQSQSATDKADQTMDEIQRDMMLRQIKMRKMRGYYNPA
jgi:CheY-like chemotaxis protein